jgi:Domain of unknown function (DUF932)
VAASLISPSLDTSPVSHPIRRERIRDTPISANCPLRRMTGANRRRDFTAELVDVDGADSRTAARNRSERAAGIVKLWTSSPTIAPIAGTRWAAYNAVTEYVDHYAKVRTSGDERNARALRAVTIGSTAQALNLKTFVARV